MKLAEALGIGRSTNGSGPKLSDRLRSLLGGVESTQRERQDKRVEDFDQLVDVLSRVELGEDIDPPSESNIADVLESAGVSLEQLQYAVATAVEVHRLRRELMNEADAIDHLADLVDACAEHDARVDRIMNELQQAGRQLADQKRDAEHEVRRFAEMRQRLGRLSAASDAEKALDDEIRRLVQREHRIRFLHGKVPPGGRRQVYSPHVRRIR